MSVNIIDQYDLVQIATSVFDKMPGGAFIYKAETSEIILTNKNLEKSLGCDNHQDFVNLTGNKFSGIIFSEDLQNTLASINEQINNSIEKNFYIKVRGKMKNGSLCKLRLFGHEINTDQYGLVFYVLSIKDSLSQHKLNYRENSDILDYAGMGIWHIVIHDHKKPRMQANKTMRLLLGIDGLDLSQEEIYEAWHSRVLEEELPSVNASVEEMVQGKFSENTYKWNHPTLGVQYVRCGGTGYPLENHKGILLRGYHYNVNNQVLKEKLEQEKIVNAYRQIQDLNDKMSEQYEILKSIASVYNSLHIINLEKETASVYSSTTAIQQCIDRQVNIYDMMNDAMSNLTHPSYVEQALEFTDLKTISERLKNKHSLYFDFIDYQNLWTRASFIRVDNDLDSPPKVIIYATQIIDEEKRKEAALLLKSNTDELTSLFNRRCYEDDIKQFEKNGIPNNLVFISIDVNGLKTINDSMGHSAGDELINAASTCLKEVFGPYGRVYRIGGDEFAAIITVNSEKLCFLLEELYQSTTNWSGRLINNFTVSCGTAMHTEHPNWKLEQLQEYADKLMYENKSNFYAGNNNNNNNKKYCRSAFEAICNSYTKILRINITSDMYHVIKINEGECVPNHSTTPKISEWFKDFADSKLLHVEDREKFLRTMNLDYINQFFDNQNTNFAIFYRRLDKEVYKRTIMELVPTEKYSKDNKELYLYVKDIDYCE